MFKVSAHYVTNYTLRRISVCGYGYIHGYAQKICGYGWEISYPRQAW